jgi:hypothetical protein
MPVSLVFQHFKTLSNCEKGYIHPARPHCKHYRLGYILHVHTAGGGKGYTLHIHTAGIREGYTLQSILAAVDMDTPCTSILLV